MQDYDRRKKKDNTYILVPVQKVTVQQRFVQEIEGHSLVGFARRANDRVRHAYWRIVWQELYLAKGVEV